MSLAVFHGRLGLTSLYYFFAISLWGYFRFFRKKGISSAYWGALAIAEILLIGQGLLGGYVWLTGLRPERGIHILYGFVVLMMIPGAYVYTKGRDERPEVLVYGTATIIGVGLLLRALFTA